LINNWENPEEAAIFEEIFSKSLCRQESKSEGKSPNLRWQRKEEVNSAALFSRFSLQSHTEPPEASRHSWPGSELSEFHP
jgi:hypothetical protein